MRRCLTSTLRQASTLGAGPLISNHNLLAGPGDSTPGSSNRQGKVIMPGPASQPASQPAKNPIITQIRVERIYSIKYWPEREVSLQRRSIWGAELTTAGHR